MRDHTTDKPHCRFFANMLILRVALISLTPSFWFLVPGFSDDRVDKAKAEHGVLIAMTNLSRHWEVYT